MKNPRLTDEQVEQEIERLVHNEDVRLGRLEQRIRYRRRQYLWSLRQYEKAGKELREAGITEEMLREGEYDLEEEQQ